MERFLKLALIVLIPVILWFTTPPEGLTDTAWRLLGFYIAGIVGLILKPYPIQIILLSVLSASALFMDNAKDILAGYGSTALWMSRHLIRVPIYALTSKVATRMPCDVSIG